MAKKKKVDYEALNSPFMRIPNLNVEVARNFLDIGLTQIYQLEGRSPESLFADIKKARSEIEDDKLPHIRLAVYFAETPEHDKNLLRPCAWVQ